VQVNALRKIGLPNAATMGEATDALRSIRCVHETYLVIDNFQFLNDIMPLSFFTGSLGARAATIYMSLL